jgi:hypothetical protein
LRTTRDPSEGGGQKSSGEAIPPFANSLSLQKFLVKIMRATTVEAMADAFGTVLLVFASKHLIDGWTKNTLKDRVRHWQEQPDFQGGERCKELRSKVYVAQEWITFSWIDQLMRVPPLGLCVKN